MNALGTSDDIIPRPRPRLLQFWGLGQYGRRPAASIPSLRWIRSWRVVIGAVAAATFGWTPAAHADSKIRVAVATATGPKQAAPLQLTKGVVDGLRGGGLRVVAGRRYRRRAQRAGLKMTDVAAAAAVRARYLVKLRIKDADDRILAQAVLRDLDGGVVQRFQIRYRTVDQSGPAGARLGENIAEFITEAAATPEPPVALQTDDGPVEVPIPPPPEEPVQSVAESEAKEATPTGEFAPFRVALSIGSELTNGYRVNAADQETGLGYDLGPLPRVDLSAQYLWRAIRLGIRLEYGFTPLTYAVANEAPDDEQRGAGSLFSFGGQIFYAIDVARFGSQGRITLYPLLGASFTALRADEAGDDSIFLGYDATEILGGARGRVLLSDSLAIEVDLRAGAVVGYSEAPTTTGDDGSGFVLQTGGSIRYWLGSSVALASDLTYQFRQTGLSGTGTRAVFSTDPALEDATVSTAHLRLTGTVIFSL